MSTRSGRLRTSIKDVSPPRTRKGVSPPRSPARNRKTSPVRSSPPPARAVRKSPARKSPSRKLASKYPARKSPSRNTKEPTEETVPKSPFKRAAIKSGVSVKLEDFAKLGNLHDTRSKRTEYSVSNVTSTVTSSELSIDKVNGIESLADIAYGLRNRSQEDVPRRSSRIREYLDTVPDIRSSVSKSVTHSTSASKSVDRFSDEENSVDEYLKERSKSVTRKLSTPLRNSISNLTQVGSRWEFGGRIGSAVLILAIPLLVFSLHISCAKLCLLKALQDLTPLKSASAWFILQSGAFVAGQFLLQAIFTLLPILGTRSDRMDGSGSKHCFNAFFATLFSVALLSVLEFFKIADKNALLSEYLQLSMASYVFAVILSIFIYVKSRKTENELNPYGSTGYALYDFFIGREIHPFIKKLDVKIWVSRFSNITSLLLLVLIITKGLNLPSEGIENLFQNYKEFLDKVQLKPTLLVFSMMQLIYILNFIRNESKMTASFFWHSEGVGYLQIVSSALYPYYFTTISKYVADADLSLSTNILTFASGLFLLGYIVMLISNNIKYEFRRNPLQPSLTNVDAMPTFHGNKLLVSGLWGVLRHPNYAGDILIHIALSLPGIISGNIIAAAPALMTIVILIHRAWRDHSRCKRRYGAAWQRYCKRVPSLIIPKIL